MARRRGRRAAQLAVLTALTVVTAGALLVPAAPAQAVFPDLSLRGFAPRAGSALAVARIAGLDPEGPSSWQVNAAVDMTNNEDTAVFPTEVVTTYPGTSIGSKTSRFAGSIGAGSHAIFNLTDGIARTLPFPLPDRVRYEMTFSGYDQPYVVELPLVVRDNAVPHGAFYFPAKASTLGSGQYWYYKTRHAQDDGSGGPSGGDQRWGYDLSVVRHNGSAWTTRTTSAGDPEDPVNSDYLIWNQPLYAMGDGRIITCYRGDPDHPPAPFDQISFENTFGNGYVIDYGDDIVTMAHFRDGTVPASLCPEDGLNEGLDIPVRAGQLLGRVGNSGRSTGPHLHLHGRGETTSGVPMHFLNLRSVADSASIQNLPSNPTLGEHDRLVLHPNSLFLPNPCGYSPPPSGANEVSYHGVAESCFQDVLHQVAARGHQPSIIDGYDVAGSSYLNLTFRRQAIGVPARSYVGLTTAQLDSVLAAQTAAGYRLHWIDSYRRAGQARYAAVFHDRAGPARSSFRHLSQSQLDAKVAELTPLGYVPITISAVHTFGALRYTGLFEKLSVPWTYYTQPAATFGDRITSEAAAGRTLTYVNGVSIAGTPYLTGVFLGGVGDTTTTEVGATSATHQGNFSANLAAGRFTRSVTGYDNGSGSARFAAVWRGAIDTTITNGPPATTRRTTVSFTFTGSNPFLVKGRCRNVPDGSRFVPTVDCASPKTYTGLTVNGYEFQVAAVDREGLADPRAATRSYTVVP